MNASQDWEDISVGDLGEIVAGGTPDRTNPSYWGGPIPWVTPSEITELKGKYIQETEEYITEAGLAGSAARLLPIGTVLVTTRATLGETAIAAVPLTTNQGFKNVVPAKETNSLYAYYLLRILKPEMIRLSSGTTFLEISKFEFARIKTRRPQIDEQRRIAGVLDTVDEAISKTESLIAKLRQVRAGLLHDLLTRGLDENGDLRDPIAHPEQFQETFAGLIPLEWEVKTLVTLCRHIGSGVTPRGGESVYTDVGVMFIRSQNVTFDGLVLDDVAFIPEGIHQAMLRSEVFAHDVLFNITGASIGRCCVMPAGLGRANVNQHVCILRLPDATVPSAAFLSSVLASPIGEKQLEALNTFGNRQGINYQQLGSFVIPWPEENERARIAQQIWAMDLPLNEEQRYLTKLRVLKSGLMSDILTGRVRVPENLESSK